MNEFSRPADILHAFTRVVHAGKGWTACCPAHEDARNSLSIGRGDDGRWLLKCHAGCAIEAILQAAHLELADLRPSKMRPDEDQAIAATFDYHDEHHTLQFQVIRFVPKNFRQRRPDGRGGWLWNLEGVRRVPYRLPDLQGRRTVFVPEGEKDADRLWALDLPATTNAGGAGKWRPEYASMLKAAGCQHVIVLPDNDPPGAAHGRDVARSCIAAQLEVKLIPLPGLPRKGDVSDYLAQHSKDDLLAIVKDAPLFNPQRLVTAPPPLTLTSLADLLNEPDDEIDWLVQDRIPAGGVVLLVAAPKAGKSTLARELAAAVSSGDTDWLGWRTSRGAVWLLIFQDKRSEVKKHFRRLGVAGTEPVRFFIDQPATDLLPRLHDLAGKERPALIIVDMLAGILPVKDLNDYAQVTQRFEPLLKLSRDSGAALLLLHHGSAHGVAREGLDAALGSTALSGSVDNVLILRRVDGQRVLSSVQRIGPDLPPTILLLNAESGRLELSGSKREFDDVELGERILAALRAEPGPVLETSLQANVEGRKADQVRVLRRLLGMGKVHRIGAGGRKDPYRYALTHDGADQVPEVPRSSSSARESSGSHDSEPAPFLPLGREPQLSSTPIDQNAHFQVQVPRFPIRVPEQELSNPVRTQFEGSPSSHDCSLPVPEVPEVPSRPQKPLNGTRNSTELTANTTSIQVPRIATDGRAVERF